MNAVRRKKLEQAKALIAQAREIVEAVLGDEQDALDNLPDSLRDGERGTKSQEAVDSLTELNDSLEQCESTCEEVCA